MFFFLFFCFSIVPFAQQGEDILYHLTTTEGLSSDRINGIIQDREGFYWIATAEGLNRFDGSSIKVFRHDRNDSTSISHNTCTNLLEGRDGDIWISTMQGVNRFIKKKGIFKRYYFHLTGVTDNLVNRSLSLTMDKEGNIWAAAFGLWKIDPGNESVRDYSYNKFDSTSISDPSELHTIYFDNKRNGLWLSTSHQLNFFDIRTQSFFHHQHNPLQWPVFKWKNKRPFFTVDREGNAWSYDEEEKKLCFIDPNTGSYSSIFLSLPSQLEGLLNDGNGNLIFSMELMYAILYNTHTGKKDTLKFTRSGERLRGNYVIGRYYHDKQKNIWICTENGLITLRNVEKKYNLFSVGHEANQLPRSVNGIIKHKDVLFFGIRNGLYRYGLHEKSIIQVFNYKTPHELRPMYNEGDSVLWLTAGDKLIIVDFKTLQIRREIKFEDHPYFIITDDQNVFWVGTWSGGVYLLDKHGKILDHYTEINGLKNNNLVSGFNDGKNIWFGYNGGFGFSRFDLQTRQFENFFIRSEKSSSAEINTITAMVTDTANNLWLGTYGGGLYYFDRAKDHFTNYQAQDGLSGDYINTLALDGKGNLWISTSNGIDIMNTSTHSFYHVNESMIFGNQDHVNNLLKASSDTFFYYCLDKILTIRPSQYSGEYSSSTILVGSFKILNKEYPEASTLSSIRLPYNKNFFSIEFSVLKISPLIPSSYKYKLDDFDKDWVNAGNKGIATYTNLPPGKYQLLLNATDETGRWHNEPYTISITITPPFWKTWWFISLISITVLSALYFFYRYRIAQVKKMYSLRSKISQDLHDEVGSTLSSIHVYSSVASKAMDGDVVKAQDALQQINVNTRQVMENMNDIVWAMHTGNNGEISFENKLKNYGYELLTPLNIACTYDINKEAEKLLTNIEARKNILLITKEAINNIAKHSDATEASVILEMMGKDLQLEIIDNGKGVENKRNGNGLQNMKSRTEALGGYFHFFSEAKGGTHIRCIIPITSIRD